MEVGLVDRLGAPSSEPTEEVGDRPLPPLLDRRFSPGLLGITACTPCLRKPSTC